MNALLLSLFLLAADPAPDATWFALQDAAVVEATPVIDAIKADALGEYVIMAVPKSGKIRYFKVRIEETTAPPPEVVIPDPPKPEPIPNPVSGKRAVVVVYESADKTAEQARLMTSLRVGPTAAYLKEHGHSLDVIDDDAVDKNGQPSPRVVSWRPQFSGLTLPALLIYDVDAQGKLTNCLLKQSLPAGTKADDVLSKLKTVGG